MAQMRACVEAVKLPPLPAHIRKFLARGPTPPRPKEAHGQGSKAYCLMSVDARGLIVLR
jgi:hypothetical protein